MHDLLAELAALYLQALSAMYVNPKEQVKECTVNEGMIKEIPFLSSQCSIFAYSFAVPIALVDHSVAIITSVLPLLVNPV